MIMYGMLSDRKKAHENGQSARRKMWYELINVHKVEIEHMFKVIYNCERRRTMKKRIVNFVFSMVIALVIGTQAVMPVEAAQVETAASARTWVCHHCGTAVYVTEVPRLVSVESEPIRKCTDPNHNSGTCYVFNATYVNDYVISCPGCGRSNMQGHTAEYKVEVHKDRI